MIVTTGLTWGYDGAGRAGASPATSATRWAGLYASGAPCSGTGQKRPNGEINDEGCQGRSSAGEKKARLHRRACGSVW